MMDNNVFACSLLGDGWYSVGLASGDVGGATFDESVDGLARHRVDGVAELLLDESGVAALAVKIEYELTPKFCLL